MWIAIYAMKTHSSFLFLFVSAITDIVLLHSKTLFRQKTKAFPLLKIFQYKDFLLLNLSRTIPMLKLKLYKKFVWVRNKGSDYEFSKEEKCHSICDSIFKKDG